ncbi:MAG: radical SAM protein [Planctomycetes bacterium]|nr:radical SAM protein [Planctomycetota bacterium]
MSKGNGTILATKPPAIADTNGRPSRPFKRPGVTMKLQQLNHQAKIALGARTCDQAYTGPLYVQVGVVNSCNYRCQFCWDHPSYVDKESPYPDFIAEKYYHDHPEIDRNKAHMRFDMFTGLVDDLHEMGTRKLKFIGRGESFLHRRFTDLVAYARSKDFNCSITTNGSLITDEQVEDLVRMGLAEIFVSVNAGSPRSYAEIHRGVKPDAFDKIKHTLSEFTRQKKRQGTEFPYMHLSFVIQNNNYFEMPDMVRLAHEVGAQRVAFNRISIYEGTKFLMLNDEQNEEALNRHLVEAERLGEQLGIMTNADLFRARPGDELRSAKVHSTIPCYIGWYFSIILADGTVNPCCECLRALGTLQTHRFKDVWFGEEYRRFRGEITDLPNSGHEVSGCRCYNCSFALHNASMHRFVHPIAASRNGGPGAGYGLKDLKRFVLG